MIYRYTKCEQVIAKIMADSNMTETNVRTTDIREWIFEAVAKIGAPAQYIQKESGEDNVPILKLEDYQVAIPEDLESLNAVAYSETENGHYVSIRSNESTFKSSNFDTYNPYGIVAQRSQVPGNTSTPITMHSTAYNGDITYFIKPGWIVLNVKDGYVKLQYRSIATDDRGYPLIPDTTSYQEAIYWYVMMKLNFPKFLNGQLGGKMRFNFNTYSYIQNQWQFYRNQAYAEAMMPNEGEMRSIKNEWNKLIPDYDIDDTSFKSLCTKQVNFNDYYYGY